MAASRLPNPRGRNANLNRRKAYNPLTSRAATVSPQLPGEHDANGDEDSHSLKGILGNRRLRFLPTYEICVTAASKGGLDMDLQTRARNILLTPTTEWPIIAEETTPTSSLITGYVVPLAAVGAVAGFIGGSLVGVTLPFVGTYRVPLMTGLASAVFVFVMAIAGVFILSFIIDLLAPTFGAQKNPSQALKVAVYSYTPAWLAGVFQIIPALGILGLLAALYGIYLLYLGLPPLMKSSQEKSAGYTAVVVVCAIVLSIVITAITGFIASPAIGRMGASSSNDRAEFDPTTPMGKLEALGRRLEESNQKMEAAKKSGDASAQTAAAFESLGVLLGGGKRVEPVSLDQLKPFVPETFAGLPMRRSNAERQGMAGIMVATAEATYGDDAGKSVTLEITDTGGASGLMGLASWAGVQGEKENDQVSEKTERLAGRLVHQRVSKTGGSNEFSIVLGERFIVKAEGDLDIKVLQSSVSSLNLEKLESMKDVGVAK
jgi:Yip1-like protein